MSPDCFVPCRLRLIASTVRSRSRLIVVCSSVSSASVSRVENTIGASLLISCSSPSERTTASNNREGDVHVSFPPRLQFPIAVVDPSSIFVSSSRRRGCKNATIVRRSSIDVCPPSAERSPSLSGRSSPIVSLIIDCPLPEAIKVLPRSA